MTAFDDRLGERGRPAVTRPGTSTDPDGRVVWLHMAGRLEFGNEAGARAELAEIVAAGGAPWVAVRLGRRRYVDVRGLAVLLDAAEALDRHGRRLAVVEPPPSLKLMSKVLDPKGHIRLIDSVADADAVFGAQDDLHVD